MLIYDFDGVMFDTVNEMAVSAYNTLAVTKARSLAALPGNAAGLFRTNRFHIQTAGDGIALMAWCLANADQPVDYRMPIKEYHTACSEASGSSHERATRFFAVRREFLEETPDAWRALNQPYRPLWEHLAPQGEYLIILTHKNREAVVDLCHHYGCNVAPGNIFSGDEGATKVENLTAIQNMTGVDSFTFVDDNFENLRELDDHFNLEKSQIGLLFATWGYIGSEDATRARDRGFGCVSQEDVIAQIKVSQD